MIINLARRAHDHNWELDPITRSLLDTDFYKLLMLQFIWKQFPRTTASFSLINRSPDLRLADVIDIEELRAQLEQTKKLRFHKSELIWLAGNTFYGRRAASLNPPSSSGWSATSVFRITSCRLKTASSPSRSAASGQTQRCGKSTRFLP